ncbi:MAG: hypothetical protein ABR985_02600 [Methanotrichaceae archaeon]|jgi:hypothetical protein
MVDWNSNATQAISNIILVSALVIVTIYYAWQTNKQARAMQDQLSFERTFRPRLDAYMKFMEIMSSRVIDVHYQRYTIHGYLRYIQPFASNDVKNVAKEIYKSTFTEKGVEIPNNFVNRINTELIPKIENEIAEITKRT